MRAGWGDRKCQEETTIPFSGPLTPFSTETQKTTMENEQLFKVGRKWQVNSCTVYCKKLSVNSDLSTCEWGMSNYPRMVYSSTKMILMHPPMPKSICKWSEWSFMGITCSEGRILSFTCGSSLDHHLLYLYHRHIQFLGYISMENTQEYSVW